MLECRGGLRLSWYWLLRHRRLPERESLSVIVRRRRAVGDALAPELDSLLGCAQEKYSLLRR